MVNNAVLTNNREYYWDNLKGFLIIMVVLGHCIGSFAGKFNIANSISIVIYTFHMPLFIFAGGYFSKKSSRPVGSRAFRMLKIYMIMQLIYMVAEVTILSSRKKFVLNFVNPSYTYWYLLVMAAFICLTVFMKDAKMWTWILTSILVALVAGFEPNIGDAFSFARILFFLPFFSLGYYINMDSFIAFTKKYKYLFTIVSIGLIALIFFLKRNIGRDMFMGRDSYSALFPDYPLYGLYYRIGAYLIIIIISCAVLGWCFKKKSLLSFVGKYTLPIYLIHGLLLKYLRKIINPIKFSSNVIINAGITLGLYVIIIGIVCTVVIFALHIKNSKEQTK